MTDALYLTAGLRTPFLKTGGPFAPYSPIQLSTPVVQAMVQQARPDFVV